jgi:hypothetical protein
MASESVKILIEAEDQASAKIANASKAIEANVKRIKDVGGQAKKSTEFIGSIAGLLGGSEIASFASQLGGLSEKVSQFSEVSKTGGAGAFAFKAGLVAAAGAIGFQLGQALGNVIFQTEKWNKEIEKATERSRELIAEIAKVNQVRFQDQQADIELIRDPEKKKAAYEEMLASLKTNIMGVEGQVKSSEKAAKEWADAWQITGDRKGFAKQAEDQAKNDRERLKALQDQKTEIERIIGIEAERAAKQKENAELDASDSYIASLREQLAIEKAIGDERFKLEAQKTARGADVGIAADLLKQLDAERMLKEERKKAEDEQKRILQEEQNARKKIIDLIANENLKHQERFVAITKGKEAASALKFEQQGVAKAEAERLAAREAELDKLERAKQVEQDVKKQMLQPQEAFQSRFLSRGPLANPNQKLEEEAAKQTKLAEDQKKELERLVKATESRVKVRDVRLEVVE